MEGARHRPSLLLPAFNLPKMVGSCSIFLAVVFVVIVLPYVHAEFVYYQPFVDCYVPSRCGNFQLKYPFAESSSPSYCRHPGFQVECREGDLLLMMGGRKFQILDIDREKQLVTLNTIDMLQDKCTEKPVNYSDSNFSISENTVAAKLLSSASCNHPPSLDHDDIYICHSSTNRTGYDSNSTYAYFLSVNDSTHNTYEGCQLIADVLILKKAVVDFSSKKIDAAEALKQGFELSWASVDMVRCPGCELTGGVCGFNASLARFGCFCIDGTQQSNCSGPLYDHEFDQPSKHGQIMKKKILIVGVSVVGAIVLLGSIFIIQYRRRISRSSDDLPPTFDIHSEANKNCSLYGLKVYEYSELVEATNSFYNSLGSGSYGEVFYGKLRDGREVAVKRLVGRRDQQYSYMKEIETLAELRHPNLVNLYGYVDPSSSTSTPTSVSIYRSPILVYEYVSNGTVAEHIHGRRARSEFLQWPTRFSIALEIASGLVYLHASHVVHCDVKSENILLDQNFRVKICDFGISHLLLPGETHKTITARGTDGYLPPECGGYRRNYHLTDKRDVYSFGVVLMELISSQPPTDEETNQTMEVRYLSDDAIEKISNSRLDQFVDPNLGFDTEYKVMIEGVANLGLLCLHRDRELRPSMEEVLKKLEAIQDDTDELEQIEEIASEGGTSIMMNTLESSPSRKIQTC